jgi:hypothetical protein
MSQPISPQHPAVVLRSHYVHMRALLAIAMLAVVSLTVAVVILASTGDSASTTSAAPAPVSVAAQTAPRQRYDGGPDEGTRGPNAAPLPSNVRYDGGPEEGTVGRGH